MGGTFGICSTAFAGNYAIATLVLRSVLSRWRFTLEENMTPDEFMDALMEGFVTFMVLFGWMVLFM
jgi:hypothetical protein